MFEAAKHTTFKRIIIIWCISISDFVPCRLEICGYQGNRESSHFGSRFWLKVPSLFQPRGNDLVLILINKSRHSYVYILYTAYYSTATKVFCFVFAIWIRMIQRWKCIRNHFDPFCLPFAPRPPLQQLRVLFLFVLLLCCCADVASVHVGGAATPRGVARAS